MKGRHSPQSVLGLRHAGVALSEQRVQCVLLSLLPSELSGRGQDARLKKVVSQAAYHECLQPMRRTLNLFGKSGMFALTRREETAKRAFAMSIMHGVQEMVML